jgi:putative ABC transport system permease protein
MATLREWVIRLRETIRPRRNDRELEEELRLHLELAAEDARRAGGPESAARVAAIRSGGVAQAMEAMRDQRGLPWLDDAVRDVRHAARLLRRNPVFTAIAVLSLGLGIGANGAIFSLADALLLRPLPVREPGAVVTVIADAPENAFTGGRLSYPNYRDLRDKARSFEGLVAYQISTVGFARSPRSVREMHMGMLVSDNFFEVLGVQPALGRSFTPEEGQVPGRDAVVVLSYDFWKNALGADPSILNSVVWMNGVGFQVVGVAPASFTSTEPPLRPAFYAPVMMAQRLSPARENVLEAREIRRYRVKGRLKPHVSKQSAQAELTALWKALERQYPDAIRGRRIAVRSELEDRIRSDPWDAVLMAILTALAIIVLVIACANIANLMLGRARARSREMAIRLALGVSRPRLLRQLLTESFLLASAGLALGLAFAYGGIRFLQGIPVSDQVVIGAQLDHRVFIVGVIAAVASAALFGLAPARRSLKPELVPALKAAESADTSRQGTIGRNLLVVVQVASAMVLLVATGMLMDGFRKAVVLDPGFRTDHLMMMSLDTSLVRDTPVQTRAFYRQLVERARALPGVASVGLTSAVPFEVGGQATEDLIPEGYDFPRGQESASTFIAVVDEHYFDTMHIEVIRGRAFTTGDKGETRGVAIVNEEFAKTYWPNRDAIGRRIRLAGSGGPWREVVGVTKTGKYTWIAELPTPFVYLPFAQRESTRMSLLVATTGGDPAALAAPLRSVVRALDANQPVFNVQTFSSLYEERAIAVPLMIMQMVGTMGLLGLTLALIGLYGLVAYSVARRTREIGIRMAIGAGRPEVLRMVLRQGLTLAIAGSWRVVSRAWPWLACSQQPWSVLAHRVPPPTSSCRSRSSASRWPRATSRLVARHWWIRSWPSGTSSAAIERRSRMRAQRRIVRPRVDGATERMLAPVYSASPRRRTWTNSVFRFARGPLSATPPGLALPRIARRRPAPPPTDCASAARSPPP